ncbi:MAG: chromate transporter [Bacillota bacterium]
MKKNRKNLIKMFFIFFKIGLFTFGGGFAMIPIMEKEFVTNQGWIEKDKFFDIISITQTVPGAVAINLSIFLAYNMVGVTGATLAAIAVALPSFMVISLIAGFYKAFSQFGLVQNFFRGVTPAVIGLIVYAGYDLATNINWSAHLSVLFIGVILAGTVFNINAILLISLTIGGSSLLHLFNNWSQLVSQKGEQLKKLIH